jgi:Luciferase-like monooxygenase/Histidine kinase-, DNA gyrase B-, and HSP90-like ATPase
VAGRTQHIRLFPNVINLPLRPPAVLARSAAALDVLSGGRVELGLGAGAFLAPIASMGAARADFDNRLFGDGDLYTNNPIRKVVGTGLGLGIARQIVEMHGGQIAVDHLEGVGSISRFTLPVAKSVSARELVSELAVAGVVA